MRSTKGLKKKVYLDNLDAKGVVVRVASLIKGESQRLLPIDGDAVEVLVGQRQPHLRRDPIELRVCIFNLSSSICSGRPEEELMAPNGFLFSCSVLSGENSVMPGKWTRAPLQLYNSLKSVFTEKCTKFSFWEQRRFVPGENTNTLSRGDTLSLVTMSRKSLYMLSSKGRTWQLPIAGWLKYSS